MTENSEQRRHAATSRADRFGPWLESTPSREVMAAVEGSLHAVADRPVRLAEVFYRYLFEMAPATRAMFADDMSDQMQKMTDTLLDAIARLVRMDTAELEIVLYRLGQDHYERYAVEPDHYLYIAHALTRAVREVAGWDYSSRLSSSWISLCQWVTGHMIRGARAAIAAERPHPQALAAIPTPRPAPRHDQRVPRRARRLSGA
ncbi:globin domain-containing protein [Pseudonocardia sp. WMMC193]|uniref:globin domain-containing protein n=1 Tax=Pseudonocardia sp. WMMC193 TaxID=2911965 RepID=UPI001F024C44|nr:globin domain-containing protein [Pseudonocardia sp. WMMC193]MCF7548348.1 globin domain-containing protein [Pseudonocardia sp. WMMC193]